LSFLLDSFKTNTAVEFGVSVAKDAPDIVTELQVVEALDAIVAIAVALDSRYSIADRLFSAAEALLV
jgi:hypothetical protein